MIPNEEKQGCHYLATKNYIIKKLTSKHDVFYYLNCFHYFRTENKLNLVSKYVTIKIFCRTVMTSEKNRILEFNQHVKSDKVPCINYADNDVLTIQRIIQRQKYLGVFLVDIQCQRFAYFIT